MEKKRSIKVIEFLRDRHLISLHGIEVALDIPRSTLSKAVSGERGLPDKYVPRIEAVLADYGYNGNS